MADNVTLPAQGTGTTTPVVSTEEITTLNGGAVSAQHLERVILARRTADGTAIDFLADNASQASVAGSASSVTILAANANRLLATIYNDSTAVLYLKLGSTASTSSFTVKMAAGSYFEVQGDHWTGIIDGIWASATGNARITETT